MSLNFLPKRVVFSSMIEFLVEAGKAVESAESGSWCSVDTPFYEAGYSFYHGVHGVHGVFTESSFSIIYAMRSERKITLDAKRPH